MERITSEINKSGLSILETEKIGINVYAPLAKYYFNNRKELQEKIKSKYSSTTEKILFKSLKKMMDSSETGLIDYVIFKCT